MGRVPAVQDWDNVDEILTSHGQDPQRLADEQKRVQKFHAELNLQHFVERDNETVAWILADGQHDHVQQYSSNHFLLLNRHSIENIGPEILNMLVSQDAWNQLSNSQRKLKVRLTDLAVKDLQELKRIVLAPEVIRRTRRRTNTYIVLMEMLKNKSKALAHISTSLKLSAETEGQGVDLLDV